MALFIWPPSPDPKDYPEPGRWEAKLDAQREAQQEGPPPPRLRGWVLAVRRASLLVCFIAVPALDGHPARWIVFGLLVSLWCADVPLLRLRPAWAIRPNAVGRADAASPTSTDD